MCRMLWKSGSLNLLGPSGPHRACNGTALPYVNKAKWRPNWGRGKETLDVICRLYITYTPWLYSSNEISELRKFLKVKEWNHIFEMGPEFYIAAMKEQWDECGGRILLGDNTGDGEVMLRRFGRLISIVLDLGFQLDSVVCTHIVDHVCTKFRCAKNCGSSGT